MQKKISVSKEKMRYGAEQKYVKSLNIGVPKKLEYQPVTFLTNSGFQNISDGNDYWASDIALGNEECRNFVSFYANNEWNGSYVWTNTETALYFILPVRAAK